MAYLQQLTVRYLRNLETASLTLDPRCNVLHGRNGSGKTSLLEAVYLLGAAKSFRAKHLRQTTQRGQPGFKVQGRVERPGQAPVALTVEHVNGRTALQADGGAVARASELAHYLPVLLVNTDSHNVVVGGPAQRRRVLDWGVFHVEHPYASVLSRYQHALKQRNAALQAGPAGGGLEHIWNRELADHAAAVDAARQRYFELWLPCIRHYLDRFLPRQPLSVRYERGWPRSESFVDTLERAQEEDRRFGYTRYGPHRANVHLSLNGVPAEQRVSRGQQKLLVMALAFAQAAVLNEKRDDPCVMLVDDLAAELDAEHRALALQLLDELGGQSVLAVTEPDLLRVAGRPVPKMFHVEHGVIQEVL